MAKLHAVHYPSEGQAPPLLIAHGLFGSARNWNVIAKRLSDRGPVTVVDMRNHGQSPALPTHSYPDLAEDLAQVIGTEQMDVLGHSMGGKAAMVLALSQPDRVNKLVVADIAPVAYSHTQQHLIDAMRAVDLSAVSRRSDAAAQFAETVPEPTTQAFLLQSLDVPNRRWMLNLDTLEAEMPKVLGFPEVSGAFDHPAFFLTGALSDYVQPTHRPMIKALFPQAMFAKIPGAGHWLHAEKPRDFEATLRVFLEN